MTQKPFDPISLIAQPDRYLISAGQVNERYILVTLKVPAREIKADRLPLNLSLIIDRSGSMSGDKLKYVKEAVIHALRLLGANDRVSIVIYDDSIEVLAPSQTLSGEVRQRLTKLVQEVYSGGSTDLHGGWLKGAELVRDHFSPNYINRLFLLTDGLANVGVTDHETLVTKAKALRREQLSTTTFGVGDDFNEFLLQGMAQNGGGRFYFIASPHQIPNYFQGELGEMMNMVARDMILTADGADDVLLELVNKIPQHGDAHHLQALLGDSYSDDERQVIFKVTLPACELRQQVTVQFGLQYEDVQQHQRINLPTTTLTFTAVSESAYHQQEVNQAVLDKAMTQVVNEAKMEMLRLGKDKKVKEARQVMMSARDYFMAGSDALFSELDQLADEMEEGMSAREFKAQHYQTELARGLRVDHAK